MRYVGHFKKVSEAMREKRAEAQSLSADLTEHVLWRIEHGVLDGCPAKAVVLMIGTNNTGHRFNKAKDGPSSKGETPIDTILGVRAVIMAIRKKMPQARIILHPIFPRGTSPTDGMRAQNAVVNRELVRFADGKKILWCDFTDKLLQPDGTLTREIMPDLLHPGPAGYEIWAKAVIPCIAWTLAAKDGKEIPKNLSRISKYTFPLEVRGPWATRPLTKVNRFCMAVGQGWWDNRLAEKQEDISNSNGEYDIVFFGDSITHRRESPAGTNVYAELRKTYKILNLGYGGVLLSHRRVPQYPRRWGPSLPCSEWERRLVGR